MSDEEVEFDSEDGAEEIEMNREFVGFNEEEDSNAESIVHNRLEGRRG